MNKNNKSGKNRARDIGFYALILVILLATIFSMTNTSGATEEYSYADVVDLFQQEQVESFYTEGSTIVLTLKDGTTVTCEIYSISIFINDLNDLVMEQKAAGIISDYDYDPEWTAPWWASFLPYLIIMVIMIVVWVVIFNRTQGGGAGGVARFSKARTKLGSDEKNKKTFADVAGADEEKEELQEIVDFLKEPKKYTEVGARVPKG
ncbi:MAG: ATP-dependent metallopeptidase FtsH/Yme1/Tma family protein, partial [Oscillospiraceae bacterium]|nr:ATP-dependent metallopeptidase FtsH/Yme1/Tma family protein [Oscillospiraceae bacterium]